MKHVDLADIDIYVEDFKVIRESEGSEGSWHEPASPPEKDYAVTKIVIEGLNMWDEEEIGEILALQPKDTVSINLYFQGEDDEDVELVDEALEIDSVKLIDNGKAMELGVYTEAFWVGDAPSQNLTRDRNR